MFETSKIGERGDFEEKYKGCKKEWKNSVCQRGVADIKYVSIWRCQIRISQKAKFQTIQIKINWVDAKSFSMLRSSQPK